MRPLALVLALLGGCGSDAVDVRPATWSYLHPAIVVPSCATSSCHSALTGTAGVTLDDEEDSYDLLLSRQYVIPGDPTSTLLYLLEGEERRLMPPDAPLPAADVELIRRWIEEGAAP